MKIAYIPKIPNQKIENNWKEAIERIQKRPSYLLASPTHATTVLMAEGVFLLALHWIYKKRWNPSHRIPAPRKIVTWAEPMGDFLLALLNLSAEVHLLKHPLAMEYASAADWFDAVAQEIKTAQINRHLGWTAQQGKDTKIRLMREDLDQLKCKENPYTPETEPNLWKLIEASIDICKTKFSPIFEKRFYIGERPKKGKKHHKGLIHAYSGLISAEESKDYQDVLVKNGHFFVQQAGRNRLKEVSLPILFKT